MPPPIFLPMLPLLLFDLTLRATALTLAEGGVTATEAAQPHRSAVFYMFVLVASLLILFFLIVALSAAVRITRRYRTTAPPNPNPENHQSTDPWQEAGRRVK